MIPTAANVPAPMFNLTGGPVVVYLGTHFRGTLDNAWEVACDANTARNGTGNQWAIQCYGYNSRQMGTFSGEGTAVNFNLFPISLSPENQLTYGTVPPDHIQLSMPHDRAIGGAFFVVHKGDSTTVNANADGVTGTTRPTIHNAFNESTTVAGAVWNRDGSGAYDAGALCGRGSNYSQAINGGGTTAVGYAGYNTKYMRDSAEHSNSTNSGASFIEFTSYSGGANSSWSFDGFMCRGTAGGSDFSEPHVETANIEMFTGETSSNPNHAQIPMLGILAAAPYNIHSFLVSDLSDGSGGAGDQETILSGDEVGSYVNSTGFSMWSFDVLDVNQAMDQRFGFSVWDKDGMVTAGEELACWQVGFNQDTSEDEVYGGRHYYEGTDANSGGAANWVNAAYVCGLRDEASSSVSGTDGAGVENTINVTSIVTTGSNATITYNRLGDAVQGRIKSGWFCLPHNRGWVYIDTMTLSATGTYTHTWPWVSDGLLWRPTQIVFGYMVGDNLGSAAPFATIKDDHRAGALGSPEDKYGEGLGWWVDTGEIHKHPFYGGTTMDFHTGSLTRSLDIDTNSGHCRCFHKESAIAYFDEVNNVYRLRASVVSIDTSSMKINVHTLDSGLDNAEIHFIAWGPPRADKS